MKRRALYFTSTNAVVIKEGDIDSRIVNLVLNPELKYVLGVAPHFWKMQEGEIVPMSAEEKSHRENLISTNGISNSAKLLTEEKETASTLEIAPHVVYKTKGTTLGLVTVLGMGLGLVIYHLFLKGGF